MLGVVPEAHVGEQGDREEDCGDPTADVGDEGEDCPVLTVRHTSSGQVLHTHKNAHNTNTYFIIQQIAQNDLQ